MASSVRRCINCFLRLQHGSCHSLREVNNNIYTLLSAWISPSLISRDGIICNECFAALRAALSAGSGQTPVLGHRSVCFGCGTSILRVRSIRVPANSEERNIILNQISPHLMHRLDRVCRACWMAAKRTIQRNLQYDAHHMNQPADEPVTNIDVHAPNEVTPVPIVEVAAPDVELPNDMENYMQYHVMGSVAQVRMKSGCLPTKFECQSDQNAEEFLKRPHKRKTGKVLVECEEPLHEIGLDLEDHLEKFVCSSGTMPSKFDCQVDPTKRLLDTTMSQKTYINKDIKEGTEFAADGIAQMECTDDWSISNTDMETKPLLKNVATNALVTVDKQTQASFKLLNRSKAVQTNATIVDVSHLLHNSPSALTMKMADKTMKCDQISSMSEQSHDIIYTVYNYLLKEYEYLKGLNLSAEELTTLEDTLSRTAKATGVSVETVTAILVLKELEKTESKNEQIILEHNYHQTNREVSQRCTPEKNKSKVSASVKKVAQRCKSAKNKNKVSASVKKAAQRCTSEKNKNKVAASVKVTSNKRKRKRGKQWSRPKQKSVRLDSEFDDTTMNNESTDSADESILFNLNNKEDIKRNGLIENKSICHNRHMEQYREEEDYSIKEKDIQEDSSNHSYNMQEELVLKCEVFNDDSNTKEEVENCSVIADDSQDNNSPHSYNIQDELVLKCEVFDDNINESPSRAEGLTTDSSVVEVKVEREDDGMEL